MAGTEDLSLNMTSDPGSEGAGQTTGIEKTEDTIMPASARTRRRAAKITAAAESHSSLHSIPTPKGLTMTSSSVGTIDEHNTVGTAEDAECTCAESDNTWEASLRRYTPDFIAHSDEQPPHLAKSKPPLGPIKSKQILALESLTNQSRKLLPSKLPTVQAKLSHTPASGGALSKLPRTPQSGEKPKTPKSETPQAKLSLRSRDNRSHSLDNSGQSLSLLNVPVKSSPTMKRSSSLSHRPDWVT